MNAVKEGCSHDRRNIIHTQKGKPHFPCGYCPISFFYSRTCKSCLYMLSNFSSSICFFNSLQSGSGFGLSWELLLPSYQWHLGCLIQWLVLSTNVTWPIIAFTWLNIFPSWNTWTSFALVSKTFYALGLPTSLLSFSTFFAVSIFLIFKW